MGFSLSIWCSAKSRGQYYQDKLSEIITPRPGTRFQYGLLGSALLFGLLMLEDSADHFICPAHDHDSEQFNAACLWTTFGIAVAGGVAGGLWLFNRKSELSKLNDWCQHVRNDDRLSRSDKEALIERFLEVWRGKEISIRGCQSMSAPTEDTPLREDPAELPILKHYEHIKAMLGGAGHSGVEAATTGLGL